MKSRLHAIVDVETCDRAGWRPRDLAQAFLEGGARIVQLRAKALPSAAFLSLCDDVVRAAAAFDAEIIVNDRADLARLSGAAGVHVGQDDIPPRSVREFLGPGAIVGYSTHTIVQIEAAVREPASYIAIGPVFGTKTKETGYDPVGLDLVRAAVERSGGRPVVAIGGITLDRARSAIDAGAAAVAVISDLIAPGETAKDRVAAYCRALM